MISYPKVANLSVVKVSRLHHSFSYYYLSTKEEGAKFCRTWCSHGYNICLNFSRI